MEGIEPSTLVLETNIIPFNYTSKTLTHIYYIILEKFYPTAFPLSSGAIRTPVSRVKIWRPNQLDEEDKGVFFTSLIKSKFPLKKVTSEL